MEVRLTTEVIGGGGDDGIDHLVLRRLAGGEDVPAVGLFLMIRPTRTPTRTTRGQQDPRGFILAQSCPASASPLSEPFGFNDGFPACLTAGDAATDAGGARGVGVGWLDGGPVPARLFRRRLEQQPADRLYSFAPGVQQLQRASGPPPSANAGPGSRSRRCPRTSVP